MCSFIFGNTTFISRAAATKVYLAFVFCFVFVLFLFVWLLLLLFFFFFARKDKNVASLAYLATQVYFPHSPLSLSFFFFFREDENMLHMWVATQALSPHRTIS